MTITRVDNLFSQEEIDHIKDIISRVEHTVHQDLGRTDALDLENHIWPKTLDKLTNIAKDVSGLPLKMTHAMTVEYSNLYGKPNLRTHLDGDTNDLIINIQLEANTVWDIGLNQNVYTLDDNSALIFNANKEIHWRVHKEFKDGEYVRMMFVRFYNPENITDYSYLPNHPDDEMFKEAREFRDSLR
jgi:hypothetical protein